MADSENINKMFIE